jgi:hypothetical protein
VSPALSSVQVHYSHSGAFYGNVRMILGRRRRTSTADRADTPSRFRLFDLPEELMIDIWTLAVQIDVDETMSLESAPSF